MNFKQLDEPVISDDPLYDLFYGGYISPEKMLKDQKDIDSLSEAIVLINQFLQEAENSGNMILN